eukprot:6458083-Amphidinium_carterae.1
MLRRVNRDEVRHSRDELLKLAHAWGAAMAVHLQMCFLQTCLVQFERLLPCEARVAGRWSDLIERNTSTTPRCLPTKNERRGLTYGNLQVIEASFLLVCTQSGLPSSLSCKTTLSKSTSSGENDIWNKLTSSTTVHFIQELSFEVMYKNPAVWLEQSSSRSSYWEGPSSLPQPSVLASSHQHQQLQLSFQLLQTIAHSTIDSKLLSQPQKTLCLALCIHSMHQEECHGRIAHGKATTTGVKIQVIWLRS